MLKIKNLSKYFGGIRAVDNCSFEIKENTITALIGPNGSGKSTIFNLVSGVLKSDSGKIIFDGKEITNFPIYKISNRGISRIFQKSRLFSNITVKENMLLAFDNEDEKFLVNLFGIHKNTKEQGDKIKKILNFVGMEESENKLAKDLSYGQKRLIEIAMAIINPHKLIMLDEPVAGVNPAIRKQISQILTKLKKEGDTILLIEHDMNFTLNLADEIVVMDEGKVIAQGSPQVIKKNPKVLEAYLGE